MFSRPSFSITTILFLLFALIATVTAAPVQLGKVQAIAKRQEISDVESALTTLQGVVDSYTATFTPLASADDLTVALTAINASVADAYAAISAASVTSLKRGLTTRDDDLTTLGTVLGNIISTLITDVEAILAQAEALPLLGALIADIDGGLNEILLAVEILLQGVLLLVAELLTAVSGLLTSLALGLFFGSIAGTLGL